MIREGQWEILENKDLKHFDNYCTLKINNSSRAVYFTLFTDHLMKSTEHKCAFKRYWVLLPHQIPCY